MICIKIMKITLLNKNGPKMIFKIANPLTFILSICEVDLVCLTACTKKCSHNCLKACLVSGWSSVLPKVATAIVPRVLNFTLLYFKHTGGVMHFIT